MNRELPDVQTGFKKDRGTRDQIGNSCWTIGKAREFQKNIYSCFIDYAKVFAVWIIANCGIKRWQYQATLPASRETCMQDKKQQLEPGVDNGLVPKWERSTSRLYIVTCLFNSYAEYIIRNAGLHDSQARIKIARRHNHFRYADDTTLMAGSEEKLKNLLIKMKEESEKVGLKLNIQKTKIMSSGPITSWQIDGGKVETVTDYFLGLQNHCGQ